MRDPVLKVRNLICEALCDARKQDTRYPYLAPKTSEQIGHLADFIAERLWPACEALISERDKWQAIAVEWENQRIAVARERDALHELLIRARAHGGIEPQLDAEIDAAIASGPCACTSPCSDDRCPGWMAQGDRR